MFSGALIEKAFYLIFGIFGYQNNRTRSLITSKHTNINEGESSNEMELEKKENLRTNGEQISLISIDSTNEYNKRIGSITAITSQKTG